MNAIVNVPICPLLSDVDNSATQVDELLFGWGVEILGEAIPASYRFVRITTTSALPDPLIWYWEGKPGRTGHARRGKSLPARFGMYWPLPE